MLTKWGSINKERYRYKHHSFLWSIFSILCGASIMRSWHAELAQECNKEFGMYLV